MCAAAHRSTDAHARNLIAQPTRTRVTEQTVYVDPVKGDEENQCMSDAQSCKTMQAPYDKMYSSYDFGSSNARMHLADGDYTSGLSISGHPVGAVRVQIVGNCENPQNVNVSPTGGTAFSVQDGGMLQVACVQVSGSGVTGFKARKMGILQVNFQSGNAVVFSDMPGGTGIAATDGGMVDIAGQVVISGNATVHWAVSSLSRMTVQEGTTYSIMGQYTIDYFLNTLLNSVVALGANVTFGGPDPAGYKYNVTSGSRVSLNGNVLPGTLPGTLNEGQVF
jgi:hypothetical protein